MAQDKCLVDSRLGRHILLVFLLQLANDIMEQREIIGIRASNKLLSQNSSPPVLNQHLACVFLPLFFTHFQQAAQHIGSAIEGPGSVLTAC